MYKFVVFQDKGDDWRWKLISTANGQTIATPGEGFSSEKSCMDNIERVKASADAPVEKE